MGGLISFGGAMPTVGDECKETIDPATGVPEYHAPTVECDFMFTGGFIPGVDWVDKPLIQALIAFLLVGIVWLLASNKLRVIPSKAQFAAEYAYNFVRNGIARDALGPDYRAYLPLLMSLFFFLLLSNVFGITFLFMYPTAASIGYAWGLALLVFVVYNGAGIARHGARYFKNSLIPAGVPWPLLPIIIPIEFLSNFIIRPLTLGLRLFGNMFAGHIVILVFTVGGGWLLLYGMHASNGWGLVNNIAGGAALIFSMALFALELLIAALQAYVFTVLSAQYVASSLAEDH